MTIAAGGTSRAVSEQHFRQLLGNLRAAEPQSTRRQKRSWWRCLGSYLGAALILAGILTAIQPSSSVAPSATTPVRLGPIALASTSGGPTWTNATVPSLGPLFAISCSTATNCVAVGETDRRPRGGDRDDQRRCDLVERHRPLRCSTAARRLLLGGG